MRAIPPSLRVVVCKRTVYTQAFAKEGIRLVVDESKETSSHRVAKIGVSSYYSDKYIGMKSSRLPRINMR